MSAYTTISAVGVAVLALGSYHAWRGARALRWPTVPGDIAPHQVSRRDDEAGTDYLVDAIAYRYRVGDRPYIGTFIRYAQSASFRSGSAEGALAAAEAAYPAGARTRVHYDPQHPARSVLHPGIGASALALLVIGLGAVIVGLYGLL